MLKIKVSVILFVFLFVRNVKSQHEPHSDDLNHHGRHETMPPLPPPPPPLPSPLPPSENPQSVIKIPTFVIYLIGFLFFLCFLIIIYLIYALQKAKGTEYKVFTKQGSPSLSHGPIYSRQVSNERTTNRQIPITTITECDSIVIEDSDFKHSGSIRDFTRNGATSTNYESKLSPIVRKHSPANGHAIISPEQMKSIIEGVLSKRLAPNNNVMYTSSKDLNELLNHMGSIERYPSIRKKGMAREKSASTPELDIYDTLPLNDALEDKVFNTISKEKLVSKVSPSESNKSETTKEVTVNDNASKEASTIKSPYKEFDIKESSKVATAEEVDQKESIINEINSKDDNAMKEKQFDYINDDIDDIPLYDSLPSVPNPIKSIVVEDNQYLLPLRHTPNGSQISYINATRNDHLI